MTGDGYMPTHFTLEEELELVLSRHSELLSDEKSAALVASMFVKMADRAARPRSVDMRVETSDDNQFGIVKFPGTGVAAFVGTHQPGDWLDEMTLDVSEYDHVEIGVKDDD